MSNPVTRRTGAARWWKQRSVTRATISDETLANPAASATTTARPVDRTAAHTVSSSNGTSDRTSTTCRLRPSAAAASAASSAIGTEVPYAIRVASVPSRRTTARPMPGCASSRSTSSLLQ